MKRNSLTAAALLAGALFTGSASAVVVGGVDFGAAGSLQHIETTTLGETVVLADGDILMGYGQINTVQNSQYSAFLGMEYKCLLYLFDIQNRIQIRRCQFVVWHT